MKKELTLGSLFSGSGGFELGGIISGIVPVFSSEIEPFPVRVTEKRMPGVLQLGDISKINGADVPPVDILTFGSPCQDMSIAGRRVGLDGSRSSLFYEAIRIRGRKPMDNTRDTQYGRMSREPSRQTKGRISGQSSKSSAKSKMKAYLFLDVTNGRTRDAFWENRFLSHGGSSMPSIGESPREENVSTLSQILQAQVPETYYLSPKACQGILLRASKRGKELPEVLRKALERQAACV